MSATRNRELSQFGSFIHIDDNNKSIGITTGATPFVGIGTTNATSKLHVVGVVSATSFSGSGSGLTSIPAGNLTGALPAIDGSALTGVGAGIVVKDSGTTVGTAGTIDFGDNLTVSAISAGIVTVTGSAGGSGSQTLNTTLGLGNTSNLGMSVGVVTATDFNSTSDINLKENIKTIENSLDTLTQLRGVTFNWKENQKPSLGVIAQEVQEILPELVNDGTIKSVNYNGIIGVLIEAVKELKKEIEELKNTKYI